jgi:hypothetical protein
LALSQGREGIVTNYEDFGASAIADSGYAGLKMLVDSWGNPVVFTRWPTCAEVNALNPATGGSQTRFADPQDPSGTLLNPQWFGTRGPFENLCHKISPNPNAGASARQAYYTVPVIWSFGPDKKYGHSLTTLANPTSADNDNIYSYRLRLGGS